MPTNKVKKYFQNISLKNDLPKLFFIVLYLLILIINSLVFYSAERQHRKSYLKFIENQISQLDTFSDFSSQDGLNQFTGILTSTLTDSEYVKTDVFLILDNKGQVLWHSNKLIEKIVESSKNSNHLIKDMKFLDMPEKDFKPYDIFEKYKDSLPQDKVISIFNRQKVTHFFKVENNKKGYYIEVLRDFKRIVPWKIVLFLQLGSLFIAFLVTAGISFLLSLYLKPMELFNNSMERFIRYNHPEMIPYHTENELGKLAENYNKFIGKASKIQDGILDDADGKNQKIIQYLQRRLILKSIHKSDFFELLLFPKNGGGNFRKFVTVEDNSNSGNILFVHFDINNIESNIDKHIIQDNFHDAVSRFNSPGEINDEIFHEFLEHSEIGPGYAYFNINDGKISWIRSGPFHSFLFSLGDKQSEILDGGDDYLPNEPGELNHHDIKNQNILVVSNELLEYINMDSDEFNGSIVEKVLSASNNEKEFLLNMLKEIHSEYPEALNQFPLISIVRLK